ncbi:MAG TPA: sodium:proton antiporter [Solirubrobacteraceae bacterium]|nr:sodium:proton antiporter [Solirubrobacteraceae bacterium]
MTSFQTGAATLGGLLVLGALVSGLARRSILSLAAVYVLAGFVLGELGILTFHADSGFVSGLAAVALIVILFRDGLEVEAELLRGHWQVPLRHLAVGMPITAIAVALLTRALVGLDWTESFLLGALLSPTDPVLSSRVVTDERVPALVRHTLNLESGLNDGLALPAVLAFAAALEAGNSDFVWWHFVLQDVGLGLVFGLVCGVIGSLLMPRGAARGSAIPGRQKALYSLGLAFATYGLTVVPPRGNGFIAVFVAAIVIGNRRADLRSSFADRGGEVVEIVKLGVFAVFGSLFTVHELLLDGWAGAGVVAGTLLLARPLAIFTALAGTSVPRVDRVFMSWFGPKGVATITFSLLVLSRNVRGAERIFDLAALAVFCSILVHGASEIPGIRWLARRQRGAAQPTTPSSAA